MGAIPAAPRNDSPGWEEFLKRLASSVLKPILVWILNSGWLVRAFALFLIGLGWLGWTDREWGWKTGALLLEIPSAVIQSDALPLTSTEEGRLKANINSVASYLGAELQRAKDGNPNHNVWSIAQ